MNFGSVFRILIEFENMELLLGAPAPPPDLPWCAIPNIELTMD